MRARAPGESALLLLDVIDVLAAHGIAHAVLGAMAASVHGAVRASLDADALAFVTVPEARRLADTLRTAGLAATVRVGDPEDPIGALVAVEDDHANRVDLLIGLHGVDRSVLARTIVVRLQGAPVHVLGREDFIVTKLYAGAPKDLSDAEVAALSDPTTLDQALLRSLARRFDADTERRLEALLLAVNAVRE